MCDENDTQMIMQTTSLSRNPLRTSSELKKTLFSISLRLHKVLSVMVNIRGVNIFRWDLWGKKLKTITATA